MALPDVKERTVGDVTHYGVAADIRKIADQVERGDYTAVAIALVNEDGDAVFECAVDPNTATVDLIDELVGDMKRGLLDSLGE